MNLGEENTFTIIAGGDYGGDKVEIEGWSLFGREKFPNYERFWQYFVVPRTNRPDDKHPKNDISDIECELMSMHWQIFNNFNFIYKHLPDLKSNNDESNDLFDHSFIKLSNTCDLTEELLFKLMVYLKKIKPSSVNSILKINIAGRSKNTIYSKLYEKNSYALVVTDRISEVRKVVGDEIKNKLKKFAEMVTPIRVYRNVIAHSWQSFHIDGKVPRPEYVKKYQIWVKVTKIIKSNDQKAKDEMVKKNYTEKELLMHEKADELVGFLNELWVQLITLVGNQNYRKFAEGVPERFDRYITGSSASNNGSHHTTASGTMSINSSAGINLDNDK